MDAEALRRDKVQGLKGVFAMFWIFGSSARKKASTILRLPTTDTYNVNPKPCKICLVELLFGNKELSGPQEPLTAGTRSALPLLRIEGADI